MTPLTSQEQAHVRAALRFLHRRCGGWEALAKALQVNRLTLAHAGNGSPPSANLAVRAARLAGVSVDDVLTVRYPAPGTCPCCGHRPLDSPATEAAR